MDVIKVKNPHLLWVFFFFAFSLSLGLHLRWLIAYASPPIA